MFTKGGQNNAPGPGRKKGVPNRWTGQAKDAIIETFERCGGVDGYIAWVNSSEKARDIFYGSVVPKLIPVQVTGAADGPVAIQIVTGVPRADADR